jgi:hypothetical protein
VFNEFGLGLVFFLLALANSQSSQLATLAGYGVLEFIRDLSVSALAFARWLHNGMTAQYMGWRFQRIVAFPVDNGLHR